MTKNSIAPVRSIVGLRRGHRLTIVAAQLDSPITGLVQTNALDPGGSSRWLFYFGELARESADAGHHS